MVQGSCVCLHPREIPSDVPRGKKAKKRRGRFKPSQLPEVLWPCSTRLLAALWGEMPTTS